MPRQGNLTWVQQNLIQKCEDNYFMMGRLRQYMPVKDTADMIRFFVEPISDDPLPILEDTSLDIAGDNYIGIDLNQNVVPFAYDKYGFDMLERAEQWDDFLRGQVILFMPRYYVNKDGKMFKNVLILDLYEDRGRDVYSHFAAVPDLNMDNYRFEEMLAGGEFFSIDKYDDEIYDMPPFIICGNYAYRPRGLKANEPFVTASDRRHEAWKAVNPENIVKVDLRSIEGFDSLAFGAAESIDLVEMSMVEQILNTYDYYELSEDPDRIVEAETENTEEEEIIEVEAPPTEKQAQTAGDEAEVRFIKGLEMLTKERNLVYRREDLINFHTSIKTNPLTILAGMSGTGKTQLAYNYARMLDLSEDNETLLFMPVSPAYSEPSDVLGYLNPINNEYVPAETGLINFLIHATEKTNSMHLVIFDEMNLSQVEYWFSPFISILEKDDEDRYLKLYDEKAVCVNSDKYPSKIKISENVVFVGTVNIDETTKDFSDRLLDRTFVITLDKITFEDLYHNLVREETAEKFDIAAAKCADASKFLSWNKKRSVKNYLTVFQDHENELEFFDEFNSIFKSSGQGGQISFRVLRNIGNFLLNIPRENDEMIIDRREAFDTVVNQTVIQKIRGTESQLQSLIGVSGSDLYPSEDSALIRLLDKYSVISDFTKVRASIQKKAEDLRINGYTN